MKVLAFFAILLFVSCGTNSVSEGTTETVDSTCVVPADTVVTVDTTVVDTVAN
jgi:hypothetical protein